uniref:Asialoglycoprotein receptor-like 1 n=1 Tax=Echeneis naucrates TaxID=173247 RepID=A0A665T1H0_ECHNA
MYILYGVLVLLLLILLMVTGIKCMTLRLSQLKLCREGWVSFQSKCYLMSTSTVTWSKAESLCQSVRGHLFKNKMLSSFYFKDFISNVAEARYSYWIGLVEHEEGHWTWVDGTDFNTTPTVNGEDCGQLHPSYRNQRKLWNDADCGQQPWTSLSYRGHTNSTGPLG